MRHIRAARTWFHRELEGHYRPTPDQPSVTELMHTELCLYLLNSVANGQAAEGVPALLDGYRAVWDAVDTVPADAEVRLANARAILWRTQRPYGWEATLRAYLTAPEEVRGYSLDEEGRPVDRSCRVAVDRWQLYERLLTEPLAFESTAVKFAEPGDYRMSSTARGIGIPIPDDLPEAPIPAHHDLSVRRREVVEVPWQDLVETASGMDEEDRRAGRPNSHWAERLDDVTLQVRMSDDTFSDDVGVLRIDRILHLVGLVSVGKSTLVMVLAVWAAQHDRRVTIVAGDNSAAMRMAHHLSGYDAVKAAPVMGQNRTRHTERLHRLQPPPSGRLIPVDAFGFDLVSTACALDAVRGGPQPLAVREAPCQHLIETDPEAPVDGWRDKPRRTCPLWYGCQRHEASRQLVEANVWIATPWSLVHTPVPGPLADDTMRYLEAAWRRSDLVLVDEADQVQANLDEMFAGAQVLLGPSDDAWIDELNERVSERLRASGRAQVRSHQVRRFTLALGHARTAADVIYQLLQRDRGRAGKPVLRWMDPDYFTAWGLFDDLAQDWAGYGRPSGGKPKPGWDSDPLYVRLREQFDLFIDNPSGASGDVASGLTQLAEAALSITEEDVREQAVRQWLTNLSDQELVAGRKISPSTFDWTVWRLELAIAVAVVADRLNLMLAIWPQVAGELDMYDALPTEARRPPSDLAVAVPESPMGNVLGFQYIEDETRSRDGELGEFRFFRYAGVGRALLTGLPDLFPADGPGPQVLLLSGTSWAGTSPRYHIDVPVGAILSPPRDKLTAISKTTFDLDIQHTGERTTPIWVSGRYGAGRTAALRDMVKALTRPGAGPGRPNRLERERDSLPHGRSKVLLLVGSYHEARYVYEELLRQKSSWQGQVRCLIPDDELQTGWDDGHLLRRGDVADFGTDSGWLLIAPILAVERGHNILNTDGVAAIGAAFFLVRPHPRPKDLAYVTQRINQYALEQLRPHLVDDEWPEYERLSRAGQQRRRAAQRQWRRLLHALVAYSQLSNDERDRVAWTQLVTIWQVVGRLLRGGQAARIYFCDAAFAPNTALRNDDLDDASTSLLHGMRGVLAPYFDDTSTDTDRHLVQALYEPLYQALTTMGDR
ncbi:transposase [Kribbella speibonae]|uniref:Transposase n=1 Tax=Kribbella speibonae TaxID=1572660 RepID=A0A4R0IR59_9ACTN|nr:transposase [Kribbella speibonae]